MKPAKKAIEKSKDMGATKSGHNKLMKAKYGKEAPEMKKYPVKFKFTG